VKQIEKELWCYFEDCKLSPWVTAAGDIRELQQEHLVFQARRLRKTSMNRCLHYLTPRMNRKLQIQQKVGIRASVATRIVDFVTLR